LHINLWPVDTVHIVCSVTEVDNITGVTGKTVNCLFANYSKKRNSKFPQSAFIIYNQFTVFAYIYNSEMTEMGDAYKIYSEKVSRNRVSSQTYHVCDYIIKMDVNLIWLEI